MTLRPAPGQLPWTALRVGLLVAGTLVLLAVGIVRLGSGGGLFSRQVRVVALVPDGLGLRAGGQVLVAGQPAGTIRAVTVLPPDRDTTPRVVADLALEAGPFALLRRDARARVRALGLLGDRVLDLAPGTSAAPALAAGDTLVAAGFADLGTLFDSADSTLREVARLSRDLRALAAPLRDGRGTLGKLLTEPTLHDSLLVAVRRTGAVLARLETGRGTLGRMLRDTSLYASVENAAVALDSAARLVNDRDGTLARLQRDTVFARQLARTVATLDTIARGLQAGRGTAGQLLVERELHDRLLRVTTSLDSLLADVRRNPSRYVKGAVRIF
ncbi:MAG: MlaD family protein [Gemmatimonadaceae bacterium]|jgi:phospholipid/cholesterol/gamma-HCH transport system substrate-binding protein|nr:MlaD family protein [Gemmatimonadaceae bacterium]